MPQQAPTGQVRVVTEGTVLPTTSTDPLGEASKVGPGAGFAALCSGRADVVLSEKTIGRSAQERCSAAGLGVVQLRVAAAPAVVVDAADGSTGCLTVARLVRLAGRTGAEGAALATTPVARQILTGAVLDGDPPAAADTQLVAPDHVGGFVWSAQRRERLSAQVTRRAAVRDRLLARRDRQIAERDRATTELALARRTLAASRRDGTDPGAVSRNRNWVAVASAQARGAVSRVALTQSELSVVERRWRRARQAQQTATSSEPLLLDWSSHQAVDWMPTQAVSAGPGLPCVQPTPAAVGEARYPLALPALVTTTTYALQRAEVSGALTGYLDRVPTLAASAGLVPSAPGRLAGYRAAVSGEASPVLVGGAPARRAVPESSTSPGAPAG
ncbi:type 2 periplasmic-binding domain-containing protein [Nocardioides acrostichi]|uniref:Uncharacterized protein n=1 Tax=Nocardioides acrostichi TaxID=2784339 RepID=A0A930UYI0_9ACTN|nr:hypothetical protein [Nocardioides acrostichi]MBF4162446.1 hypothetical protein [Nocardioides acrostichi]